MGNQINQKTAPYSSHTAPQGYITFTAVDRNLRGHSVMTPTGDYRQMAKGVNKIFASMSRVNAAKVSLEIINGLVGCDGRNCKCDVKNALPAFMALMLKHPDKHLLNPIIQYVEASANSNKGASVTLQFFGSYQFSWAVGKPRGTVQ